MKREKKILQERPDGRKVAPFELKPWERSARPPYSWPANVRIL